MQIKSKTGRIIPVLYEDNHLLVVNKPAGLLVQADKTGDEDLLSLSKTYLKTKYEKPGNVFLGLVHRLDRPVSGVVLLARTSKAAGRLSQQIREYRVKKTYLALVQGIVPIQKKWQDNLDRKGATSFVNKEGKQAILSFKRVGKGRNISLVEIELITGRHHQIRVQFSSRGYPLLGDYRYAEHPVPFGDKQLGLHAVSVSCTHPTTREHLTFECAPDRHWKKYLKKRAGEK
ncbi:MAG: RNA pseudouridine synthase [Desulfobulbus propionicus]|nr:MAG: RNA pseudouridine synthase [Desulfobulbus propionicus]